MQGTIQRPSLALEGNALFFLLVPLLAAVLTSCEKANAPRSAEMEAAASVSQSQPHSDDPLAEPPPRSTTLPEEVAAILDRLATEFPRSAAAFYARGAILERYGQSNESLWCWRNCLALDPQIAEAHEQIAFVAMKRGEFEQAVDHLTQACELKPDLPEANLHLGKALLRLGRYEEAVAPLKRQIALQPKGVESWFRLGQAHLELGDFGEAKTCFQSAIDLHETSLPAWFGMAQVYERQGEALKARECHRRFLELDKALTSTERNRRAVDLSGLLSQELPRVYAIAADVYAYHGQDADAQTYWRRAAGLDHTNVSYRLLLARSLAQENRAAEAIVLVEELQNLQPRNAAHLLVLADLHQQLQQFEAAEKDFERAMEIDPDLAQAPLGLARLYLGTRNRLPEARRLVERAIRLEPTAESYFLLSLICEATKDRGGARTALEEALRLEPQNPQYAAAAGSLGNE
jgi:tetratricopeptide (TPR) repeat protein